MGHAGNHGADSASTVHSDAALERLTALPAYRTSKDQNALLTSSIWCGMVFSLALVITVLNLMPPVPVGYRVTAQVLASATRLESLRRELAAPESPPTASPKSAPQPSAKLLAVDVLDARSHATPAHAEAENEALTLVEVGSLWPGRTNTGRVRQWLTDLTKTNHRALRQFDSAAAQRFAHWEVEVRDHYLKQFRQTRLADAQEGQSVASLASNSIKSPTRFASLSRTSDGHTSADSLNDADAVVSPADGSTPIAQSTDSEVEAGLVHELAMANQREVSARAEVVQQAAKANGVLTLSGAPHVTALPGNVPTFMVMSVLVLALAGGAIGGWTHHRVQAGGTFRAIDVAATMSAMGLPTLGRVRVLGSPCDPTQSKLLRGFCNARRWIMRQTMAGSELVVLFWCLAIVIRMVLDPLWRAMLWTNPLAAMGRLFIGLP